MRSKRDTAWETAAKCAVLAKEADGPQEREYYVRMRDAWIILPVAIMALSAMCGGI